MIDRQWTQYFPLGGGGIGPEAPGGSGTAPGLTAMTYGEDGPPDGYGMLGWGYGGGGGGGGGAAVAAPPATGPDPGAGGPDRADGSVWGRV
jgi:hypothetical protein